MAIKHLHITVAAAALLAATAFVPAQAETVELRLMETTDIHVHLVNYDYYRDRQDDTVGLAKVATLLEQARAEVDNALLFDNGDLIQGNPMGDYMANIRGLEPGEVHPVYKAMNLLDYAVGNLGNHEFNYGIEFLETAIAGAAFPYVSANVFIDDGDGDPSNDQTFIDPYIILDRHGHRHRWGRACHQGRRHRLHTAADHGLGPGPSAGTADRQGHRRDRRALRAAR